MIFVYIIGVILAILIVITLSWVILSPIISALTRIADVLEQFDVTITEEDKDA